MSWLTGPYKPEEGQCSGPFIVVEGVSGVGKSTLTRILGEKLNAATLHTLPEPLSRFASATNRELRPLPQFAFYLAGALHASDVIREGGEKGPVVADRYVSSVIACHAAAHGASIDQVTQLLEPFRPYLVTPDRTFYLRCSEELLRTRMKSKTDLKADDTELFDVPGRLPTLLDNFEAVAAADPTAVVMDTDGRSPDQLAENILATLEADRA
ncbi:AAA family ATPase [Streptomyces sp. NPDC051776]|uniref:dTMP kinase n=1 Tax=Streptomyces sp. NPDC051776 TaxID=3155414 RepID=UPI0034208532